MKLKNSLVRNLLCGTGSVFNLFPRTRPVRKRYVRPTSDADAISGDFRKVGEYLWMAINEQNHRQETSRNK